MDGWENRQLSPSLSLLATGYSSDTQNSFQILRYINSKNQRREIKLKKTKKNVCKASSTLDSSPSGGGTSGECGKKKGLDGVAVMMMIAVKDIDESVQ